MFRILQRSSLRSYMPKYSFSNKGFNNFKRNKKSTQDSQNKNLNDQQEQPDSHTLESQIQQDKNSKLEPQGFANFQQKGNKKPFDKQLFERMRRQAENKLKQKQEQHVHASKQQNKPKTKKNEFLYQDPWGSPVQEQEAKKEKNKIPKFKLQLLLLGLGLTFGSTLYFVYRFLFSHSTPEIIYSELIKMVNEGKVKQIVILHDTARPEEVHTNIRSVDGEFFTCKVQDASLVASMVKQYNSHNNPIIHLHMQTNHNLYFDKNRLKEALFILVNVGIFWILFKSMGSMKTSTGGAKNASKNMFAAEQAYGKEKKMRKTVNVKFKDVAGMSTPKKQITEFVQFLKHPEKFRRLGARIPRGALLTGPPGTGKTLLAKACAGQAKVSFFSTSGSQFVQKFVGVGAARVRQLFKQAKASAPSIIFIDEIDAVGRKRWKHAIGGNDERDSTLNQLLVEMDGFGTQQDVVVFAATNRKQMLDDALLRPGRFDRIIQIQLPDLDQRYQMFLVHLNPIKLSPEISTTHEIARRMAMLTPGFSGADIFNVCNQAAILAARDNRGSVTMMDFQNACDRIVAGTVKRNTLSLQERKVVAYHQAGHGVVSWFLEGANPLLKLTIVPRSKGSLGFAQYLPTDKKIFTKQNMVDQLAVILGGRASQMQFFGKLTTGAADDLQRASQAAYNMVKNYGMGAALFNRNTSQTEYMKQYSEYTGAKIDKQVRSLISEGFKKAKQLVKEHRQKIQKLSQLLLSKQTIDTAQIQQILGIRPFDHSETYKNFISKV